MVLLYANYLFQVGCKEVHPIIGWNDRASTFVAHKLSKVTLSRVVDHLSDAPQAPNFGSMVVLLEKPETPIWRKVGVADYQRGESYGGMPVCESSQCSYFYSVQCSYLCGRTPLSHRAHVSPGKSEAD